ncbi:MAG: hypothetical protein D6820_03505, partial [Lentisphaerae bacterium]
TLNAPGLTVFLDGEKVISRPRLTIHYPHRLPIVIGRFAAEDDGYATVHLQHVMVYSTAIYTDSTKTFIPSLLPHLLHRASAALIATPGGILHIPSFKWELPIDARR